MQILSNKFVAKPVNQLPSSTPLAFTATFYADQQKKAQWKAFVKKTKADAEAENLQSVVESISLFTEPVFENLREGTVFQAKWQPERGWLSSD